MAEGIRKLVLFDIDGTLLWTDGAGRRAIRAALLAEMGTAGPIDGYRFDGKTDHQIIHELMEAAGHPQARSPEHVDLVCRRYVSLLVGELEASAGRCLVYPGVLRLLDLLEQRGDAVLGLLTGNLVDGASLKLRAVGLDPARFQVGAFGSDAAERPRLPGIAAARAAPLMGRTVSGPDLVIVGDTPADVTCGASLGARAIGVATGSYSAVELLEAGAFASFESFADPAPVLAAVYA
jgi:phosphoglycolate phosphatase-like HAD superfamily hydrolase